MTIHIKSSSDAGAPVLSSAIGALIPVLDWFLVTECGWTKEHQNGTTGGAYRAPTGNRFYYQFNSTLAYMTEMRSFETMSAWNTGFGGSPAASMYHVNWSVNVADATPVAYTLISDGTFVMMITYVGVATTGNSLSFWGDFISYLPSDNYASICCGPAGYTAGQGPHANNTAVSPQRKVMRAADQVAAQVDSALITTSTFLQAYLGAGDVMYPNEVTGGLMLFPALVVEGTPMVVRGRLPGILSPTRVSTLLSGTTFNGTGDLAGRTYKVFQLGGTSYSGKIAIETSDTWRT